MAKLANTFYVNLTIKDFCVTCPLCHHANGDMDLTEDENQIIYPEEEFRTIQCKGCGQELNVLATQFSNTDIQDPAEAAEAIAKRDAFTDPKRVRDLEFALWSLTFALYEEKGGFSSRWPLRIQEPLQWGRQLIQHRDGDFRPLINETSREGSLYRVSIEEEAEEEPLPSDSPG